MPTPPPVVAILGLIGAVLGALFFAGSLARGHYAVAPGLVGGVICAAIGIAATRPLFARVRARLDRDAAGAVPLYAEGIAIVFGALSVLAPPVGVIGLAAPALAARRRPAPRGPEVRRPADPALSDPLTS